MLSVGDLLGSEKHNFLMTKFNAIYGFAVDEVQRILDRAQFGFDVSSLMMDNVEKKKEEKKTKKYAMKQKKRKR